MTRKLKGKKKVVKIEGTIASMEAEQPSVESMTEVENMLVLKGCNIADATRGDMMLSAAQLGLINCLKTCECPQYRLDYVNGFGEGLLHYAAKGN